MAGPVGRCRKSRHNKKWRILPLVLPAAEFGTIHSMFSMMARRSRQLEWSVSVVAQCCLVRETVQKFGVRTRRYAPGAATLNAKTRGSEKQLNSVAPDMAADSSRPVPIHINGDVK
jgi:hypothetical protein